MCLQSTHHGRRSIVLALRPSLIRRRRRCGQSASSAAAPPVFSRRPPRSSFVVGRVLQPNAADHSGPGPERPQQRGGSRSSAAEHGRRTPLRHHPSIPSPSPHPSYLPTPRAETTDQPRAAVVLRQSMSRAYTCAARTTERKGGAPLLRSPHFAPARRPRSPRCPRAPARAPCRRRRARAPINRVLLFLTEPRAHPPHRHARRPATQLPPPSPHLFSSHHRTSLALLVVASIRHAHPTSPPRSKRVSGARTERHAFWASSELERGAPPTRN